jgi:hypothetical protein
MVDVDGFTQLVDAALEGLPTRHTRHHACGAPKWGRKGGGAQ